MFDELLAQEGVEEVLTLRSTFGFMAYHGGGLEEMTEVIAQAAAEKSGASYYGVHQPAGMEWHIPSHKVVREHSDALGAFLDHVDIVIKQQVRVLFFDVKLFECVLDLLMVKCDCHRSE